MLRGQAGDGAASAQDWMGSPRSPMGCGLEEVNGALQAAPSLQKPF